MVRINPFSLTAAIVALSLACVPAPGHAGALKGSIIGAGVGAMVGGKKGARNGALAGAVIGGVKKNKRKR